MANKRDKDLLDELNCADACEAITALCSLVDKMVHDIQQLELEWIVSIVFRKFLFPLGKVY